MLRHVAPKLEPLIQGRFRPFRSVCGDWIWCKNSFRSTVWLLWASIAPCCPERLLTVLTTTGWTRCAKSCYEARTLGCARREICTCAILSVMSPLSFLPNAVPLRSVHQCFSCQGTNLDMPRFLKHPNKVLYCTFRLPDLQALWVEWNPNDYTVELFRHFTMTRLAHVGRMWSKESTS